MAALLFKVGTLFIKTVSKPFANRVQRYVMNHPVLRDRTITAAQYLHRADVYINRGAEGKSGKVFVGNLSEDKAVELASKVVSESFIFSVGVGIVALEYQRNAAKDKAKKEKEDAFRRHLDDEILREKEAIHAENVRLNATINAILQRLERLEGGREPHHSEFGQQPAALGRRWILF